MSNSGSFFVVPTIRGALPQLTPDQARSIFTPSERFLSISTFDATDFTKMCRDGKMDFAYLAGSGDFKVVLSCRSVFKGMHTAAPSSDKAVAEDCEKGRVTVTPGVWREVVEALKPFYAVPLHDSISLSDGSLKRRRTMLNRSEVFKTETAKSAANVVLLEDLGEFCFQNENSSHVGLNLAELPKDDKLYYAAVGSIVQFLACLVNGVNFVEWSLPWFLAAEGQALTLSMEGETNGPTVIDLNDDQYTLDIAPLQPHCQCFTCTRHNRAYLHHLLTVQEMNSEILLSIHNVYLANQLCRKFRALNREQREQLGITLLKQL